MSLLPLQYKYLNYEPAPKMLLEAIKLFGVEEVLGEKDSPIIMSWAKETGIKEYKHDSTAWCGLGMAIIAKRAGWEYKPMGNALWALNWAKWGIKQNTAMLGDVLVYKRKGGGHVTQYVGEDKHYYHCLGFNQSDACNIVRKLKEDVYAIRRAPWKIKQPNNVRIIMLDAKGPVSVKEN